MAAGTRERLSWKRLSVFDTDRRVRWTWTNKELAFSCDAMESEIQPSVHGDDQYLVGVLHGCKLLSQCRAEELGDQTNQPQVQRSHVRWRSVFVPRPIFSSRLHHIMTRGSATAFEDRIASQYQCVFDSKVSGLLRVTERWP